MVKRRLFDRTVGEAEAVVDWLKYRLRRRRPPGEFHIQAYLGHGSSDTLYISGRVFEGVPIPAARRDDAALRNLWHTLLRLASDEVPAARVRATMGDVSQTVVADDEGFFHLTLPARSENSGGEVWREVDLELLDPPGRPEAIPRATGLAIVPAARARFGIISDIDDTIVETDVANALRMLRLVLLTNAHTRLPLAGVAAFYRALRGPAGPFTNPVFYVSSSPWNFYDLLTEVLEVHEIPAGPLFLKDYGLARDLLLGRGHMEHKMGAIEHILKTHPRLKFVLVGDSGQMDPEIYREAARLHPGRIEAIYIRAVDSPARNVEVEAIAAETASEGVEMVLVRNTVAAAEHAAARGLIDLSSLSEIRSESGGNFRTSRPIRSDGSA